MRAREPAGPARTPGRDAIFAPMSAPDPAPHGASADIPATGGLSWFDGDDAPTRRELETCIHCGLCLTACPTYRTLRIEPDSPRGRLYLMRGLAEGRIEPDAGVVHHLDQCLDCRACESVCPAGVPYGRLLEQTRGQLARRVPEARKLGAVGEWVLRQVMPDRARMHLVGDLLRLAQSPPVRALMGNHAIATALPRLARQGYAMTPPVPSRAERALDGVAGRLPAGARAERRPDALVFHPAGAPRLHVGFFTSCVMEVLFSRVNQELVRLLVLAGCRVTAPTAQTCCGALHAHAGLRRESRELARRNVSAFAHDPAAAYDAIVTDSAGCGAALRESPHLLADAPDADAAERFGARVRDVSEILDQVGLPAGAVPLHASGDPTKPLRVGYHDPCHLAHAQGVRHAPRRLLRALPGVELVDLPDSDWCCGSAGIYNLTHPDMADTQLAHKLDTIAAVAPELVVASNPGCALHIARGVDGRGLGTRVVHLLDVLAMAYPAPAR